MIRFTLSHDQNVQIPGAGMRVVPRTADVFVEARGTGIMTVNSPLSGSRPTLQSAT